MNSRPRLAAQLCCALTILSLSSCHTRDVASVDPAQQREQLDEFELVVNRDLDVLFIVDNSNSMRLEQESLQAEFGSFINVLAAAEGGLPNLHLGVISTDLGTGGHSTCPGSGDRGVLQNAASTGCVVTPPSDRFIIDVEDESGVRQTNYPSGQSLEDTFSCIAGLGINGCGFEQPLEAMRQALDGSNAENSGFLREEAQLAVVFITDEDDCSASDPMIFDGSQDSESSLLGHLTSFRCFEFGVRCDPDTPRALGPRADCRPRDDSPYLSRVSDYAEFLLSLKPDPRMIHVAAISGDPSPVAVRRHPMTDKLDLTPSCSTPSGSAVPPVRLQAFLSAFPGRNTRATICNENLASALDEVAGSFVDDQTPCLHGALRDIDPDFGGVQPDCEISERDPAGVETSLPECDNLTSPSSSSTTPCYVIAEDERLCPNTETMLSLTVYPEDRITPFGARLRARCRAD